MPTDIRSFFGGGGGGGGKASQGSQGSQKKDEVCFLPLAAELLYHLILPRAYSALTSSLHTPLFPMHNGAKAL